MANPCEVYEEWFDDESEDVIDDLGELINQALESWGFDPVTVIEGDLSDEGVAGMYDSGVIYLDPSHEVFESPDDTLSVAYHEAMHAAMEQAGFDFDGVEEEFRAAFMGGAAARQALEGCSSSDPAGDSGTSDNYAPPYPFTSHDY